jgi:hypothetical protein
MGFRELFARIAQGAAPVDGMTSTDPELLREEKAHEQPAASEAEKQMERHPALFPRSGGNFR